MGDYLNGKIYKIGCNITGEIYIGSTIQSLEDRLSQHIRDASYYKYSSKQIIDRNAYYIEQLESYPCNSQFELRRKEGEYQKTFKCVNKIIAGRTPSEYDYDNREKISEYKKVYNKGPYYKQYRIINAEMIKERHSGKVTCECGCEITYGHIARHRLTKNHIAIMAKLN